MGKVIYANFEGGCVACSAERDKFDIGIGGHMLALLLLLRKGFPLDRICEDLCSEHKRTLESAYQSWLEEEH